jgi:hypothetical protein
MAVQAFGAINQQEASKALAILPQQGSTTIRVRIKRIIAKIGRRQPRLR